MNIKITSKKGTYLGSFRTVEDAIYFNPSKQLQNCLENKTPSSLEEWNQIIKLISASSIEELVDAPAETSSFEDL